MQGVTALEMGPRGDADVTSNIFEAVEAGPVLCHAAQPPADGRPLLHIAAPHHQLSHPAIQQVRSTGRAPVAAHHDFVRAR